MPFYMPASPFRVSRPTQRLCTLAALSLLAGTMSGCSISPLSHEGLAPLAAKRSGSLMVAEKAEGLNGSKVGWGRITVFAIPVVPIYIAGDESIQLMDNISEALRLAGYSTNSEDETTGATSDLRLVATVHKTRYSNYTWFAPLIPTWGGMDVTLTLVNKEGESRWTKNFVGSGFTFNFFDGYNIASKESMTELLNQMAEAFTEELFYQAVSGGALAATQPQPMGVSVRAIK